MFTSLKRFDDRPKVLWRFSLVEPKENSECKMRNTPLEVFICTQTDTCKYDCLQKKEQILHQDYVRKQQYKMILQIKKITKNNNGDNGKKKSKLPVTTNFISN